MKLKHFRVIILVIALFVVGACSSNNNDNNNNDDNNNNNNNEEVQNNENEDSENNNENENDNDSNDNNNNEENTAGDENNNNDGEQNDNEVDISSVDFEDITFGYTGDQNLREMLDLDDEMPMVGYIIDPLTGTSFNIIAEQLPMELTLDEYVELAKENQGIEFENEENITINGIDMYEFDGYQDGVPVIVRIFLHNNVAYVLSYGSGDEDSLEEHKPVLEEISESIELN